MQEVPGSSPGATTISIEKPSYESETFVHAFTLFPRHLGSSQMRQCVNHVSGTFCRLCLG